MRIYSTGLPAHAALATRAGLLLGVALSTFHGVAAMAQSTPADTAPAASAGDIVVTARRRSEALERVPVSVTAFGAEQLQARSLLSEADLQRNVAGLTVRSGQTNNLINFSIRGQSLDLYTGSQPGVLPYVNDVQISSFSTSAFYDLESIQALKGPQGTLFGRNATGGAVLFSTAKPTNKLEGFITGRLGNYDMRALQGALNIPMVDDRVLLRVAGSLERRDGYQYNVYQDVSHGRTKREAGRISLTLKPFEGFSNTIVAEYSRSGGDNLQLETWSAYSCGQPNVSSTAACLFSPALDGIIGVPGAYEVYRSQHPGTFAGGYLDQVAYQKQLGPWKVNSYQPSVHRARSWYVTNTTTVDLADDLTFKNIVGLAKAKSKDQYDPVGTGPFFLQGNDSLPAPNYVGPLIGTDNRTSQWSEEAQISGKTGNLDFIVGFYAAYQRLSYLGAVSFVELLPFIPKTIQTNQYKTVDKTQALYAQLSQDLSGIGAQGLKLTGGFRYTWEQFSLRQGPLATQRGQLNAPINPAVAYEKKSFSAPSWTIGLEYQANSSLMLYAAQRGSWRSGGINGQGPARFGTADVGGNVFKSETTYDIELGAKYRGAMGDVPVHGSIALYSQWIKNVQRVIYTTPPPAFAIGGTPALQALTVNVPRAKVRGIELDAGFNPTSWLDIGGSFTYTDAKFTKGQTILFGGALNYGPYADTPKYVGTVYAAVTLPVPDSFGQVTLRGDVYAQSGQYFSNLAASVAPDTRIPGYKLVNLRLDARNISGTGISVAAFAKNLFKVTNYTGGIALIPFGSNGVIPGEPRTYGVEATFRF